MTISTTSSKKGKIISIFLFFIAFHFQAISQQPFVYYQFEVPDSTYYRPSVNSMCTTCTLDSIPNNCDTSTNISKVHRYLDFQLTNGQLKRSGMFVKDTVPVSNGITINVLINLDPIFELQRKNTFFNLVDTGKNVIATGYIDYAKINFETKNNSGLTHKQFVRLKNTGVQSWDYYLNPDRDDNWHLLSFVYDGSGNGSKKIYVDGLLPGYYSDTIFKSDFVINGSAGSLSNSNILNKLDQIIISASNSYDQLKGYLDEVAIYPYAKTAGQIYKDFLDVDSGLHYSEGIDTSSLPVMNVTGEIDTLEFPVNYNEQDTNHFDHVANPAEQFKSYPLPRFLPGHQLNRNVNIAKAMRMSGIYNNNLISGGVPDAVELAVEIQNELAENWNYYYNFSENIGGFSLRMRDSTVSDTDNVNAAYITNILNSGKNYPLAGLLLRRQMDVSTHPNSNFHSCSNIYWINDTIFMTSITNPKCLARCPFLEPSPYHIDGCFEDTMSLYPRDNSNNIVFPGSNRPSWSPFSGNRDVYQPDGHEMTRLFYEYMNPSNNYYLNEAAIKRIKVLAENNEILSSYPVNLLKNISDIDSLKRIDGFDSLDFPGLSRNQILDLFQSYAKANIDIDFRDSILFSPYNDIDLNLSADCKFINYFVDGRDNAPFAYKYIRESNSSFRGNPSLTCSIYPQGASVWYEETAGTDVTGWQFVSRGRNTELKKDEYGNEWNDKWISPFINAGSNEDERDDMRPGQYLGFLKAVDLLGVDFFVPGYYNEKVGLPANLGRSFCWQLASPVYTQALNSRTFDFFENGYLLDGDVPFNLAATNPNAAGYKTAYRFNTDKPEELIVARKMNDKELYLITGTLQASSSYVGAFGLETETTIQLKDTGSAPDYDLSFNIKRQGATYIFDNTDEDHPAFWQIDKWHQYEHPERWTKDFDFEAEVMDNVETTCTKNALPGVTIKTVDKTTQSLITNGDFTEFTSYISFETPSPLEYRFTPRNDGIANDYTFYVMARADTSSVISGMSLTLTDLTETSDSTAQGYWKINCINSPDWNWYGIDECSNAEIRFSGLTNDHEYMLTLVPLTPELEIDRIYLATNSSTFSETPLSPCSYDTIIAGTQNASTVFGATTVANIYILLDPGAILQIDDDFTFENCIFTMGSESYITLDPGDSLVLNDCGFSSCDSMWVGMAGYNGNVIVCNQTTVQDAKTAVDVGYHSKLYADYSLFDKNKVSINAVWDGDIDVDHSVFDCSGILRPANVETYKTIKHINASRSDVKVANSTFKKAERTSLLMELNGDMDIADCFFEGNRQAVRYDDPAGGSTINIERNLIKARYDANGLLDASYGISVFGSGFYDIHLNIIDNDITDFTRPVLIYNITDDNSFNKTIKNNIITLNQTAEQLSNVDVYRGIKVVNSNDIDITNNSVKWTKNDNEANQQLVQGITLVESTEGLISENLLENLGGGISVFDDCMDYELKCNTMNKCYYGVYLDTIGADNKLTDQGLWTGSADSSVSWKNRWVESGNSVGFKVYGILGLGVNFNWTYNPSDSVEYSPLPSVGGFTDRQCSTTTGICTTPAPVMQRQSEDSLKHIQLTPDLRDHLFGAIIGDSSFLTALDPAFLYHARLNFFEAVRKDSRLLHLGAGNDSAYIVAYDSLNLSNMGILHDVMLLIKDSKYIHAESKLSEIVNSNNIESNTMFALNLYLNYYVKNEIPDSSIYLKMEHIRHAHPFYNGKGVYILRGLMREDIIDELPAPSGVKSVPENKKSAQTAQVSGKLQPNPANNSVTVMLNQQLAENSILHVYNGMGLLIREIPMPKNTSTFEINTSDFKTGIYMICLTSNKNLLKFQRLVIIQ